MMNKDFSIEKFLDLTHYATDVRTARRKTNSDLEVSNTNEFFTPYEIVRDMADRIPEEKWSNPDADFLEPSMGNGQFVCYIVWNKIMHGSTWEQALKHTWGVELLEDNVKETKQRVVNMLAEMEIEFDKAKAMRIMRKNLVQSDFFKWSFEKWEPLPEPDDGKSYELF